MNSIIMTKFFAIIILPIVLLGCSQPGHNEYSSDRFRLDSDLFEFSSKLNEGDTLFVYSNLSVCKSIHHERDIFTKKDSQVFIQTQAKGVFLDEEWEEQLPKREYNYSKQDSLNFEDLFRTARQNRTKKTDINALTFRIIFKNDTIDIYSDGLSEQIPNSEYFLKIKRKIYPTTKIYEPNEIPDLPPPPAPSI
ncbi:MAG: hypothetical protein ACQESN_09935 [Thermotogota bacterium]